MSHPASQFPFPLSGLGLTTYSTGVPYGGHWQTITTNNSGPVTFASSAPLNGAQLSALAQQAAFNNAYQAGLLANPYTAAPPPKPEPIENAGIVAGEIIGHRAWRLHHGLLQSMFMDIVWSPKEPMVAAGSLGNDYCGSGVHAFKSQQEVLQCYARSAGQVTIIGTVALWGEVIEHDRGYRAECGKVHSVDLVVDPNKKWWEFNNKKKKELLDDIRETYGLSNGTQKVLGNTSD